MKLWLITREGGEEGGGCTYYGAVVAAETEEEAKLIYPLRTGIGVAWIRWDAAREEWRYAVDGGVVGTEEWPVPSEVEAKLLGEAAPGTAPGVILSDYDARP